jgi:hypothetical protein
MTNNIRLIGIILRCNRYENMKLDTKMLFSIFFLFFLFFFCVCVIILFYLYFFFK